MNINHKIGILHAGIIIKHNKILDVDLLDVKLIFFQLWKRLKCLRLRIIQWEKEEKCHTCLRGRNNNLRAAEIQVV